MDEVRAHRRLTRLNLASNKITAAGSEAVAKSLEPIADGGGILKWLRRMSYTYGLLLLGLCVMNDYSVVNS